MTDDGLHVARRPSLRAEARVGERLPDLRRRMVDELRESDDPRFDYGFSSFKT